MNLDQLSEFCAYFQINRNLAYLPIRQPLANNNQEKKNRNMQDSKKKKKKIEVIAQPKVQKITKSKVQVPSKKQKYKDPVSTHVTPQQNNLDLNFFINHMAGSNTHQQHNNRDNYRNYAYNPYNQDRNNQNLNKYNTFGRNETFNDDLPVYRNTMGGFKSKVSGHQNYVNQNNNVFQPNFRANQNFGMRSQINNFQNYPNQNNFYQIQQSYIPQNKYKVNNGWNTNSKISQRNINPFQILSLYSPINRQKQVSPSHSTFNINSSAISDRSLSKSRNKHKRKNSERPFYDASSSRVKDNKQKQIDNKVINQSIIDNSQFISHLEISKIHPYSVKKSNNETKRQTMTSNSINMKQYGLKRQTFDLDDQIQEPMAYITHQQKSVPIAINLQNINHDF